MNEYVFDCLVIFILIGINSILAMAEIAIISSNRLKMEGYIKHSKSAKIASHLMDNPGSFLSTIQIGITIIGVISGAFSGQKFAEPLGIWLNNLSWINNYGNFIAFSFVIISITYISIVLGELIPKRLAMANPEKIAIFFASPILFLSKIAYPFVWMLDISTKRILKILKQTGVKDSALTEEEIHLFMRQGLIEGAIDAFEHKVFRKVMQFGDREASIIMTPRIKVIYLDLDDSLEENLGKITKNPHRYYPVFEGGLDNFKGILDIKEAFTQKVQGKKLDLRRLVKEAPCVIEDNLGPDLIDLFKKHKTHITVVMDEYGVMQGIITLVDIFETLVESIPESHQEKHYEVLKQQDGSWMCDGLMPIDEIEELLEIEIVKSFEGNDFNTLAGFLLTQFRHIPKSRESLNWNGLNFEIVSMEGTRINKVLVKKL